MSIACHKETCARPTTADAPPAPAAPRNAPLPLNEILQHLDTKTMRLGLEIQIFR